MPLAPPHNPTNYPLDLDSEPEVPRTAESSLPWLSRKTFGWLFLAFCMIQLVPGFYYEASQRDPEYKHYIVGRVNLRHYPRVATMTEYGLSIKKFLQHTMPDLLALAALAAYLLLNIRMIPKRLSISPPTILLFGLLINSYWYFVFFPERDYRIAHPIIGVYLQAGLLSLTSLLAYLRLQSERQRVAVPTPPVN